MINDSRKLFQILLIEDSPSDTRLTLEAFKYASLPNQLHIVKDGEAALDFLYRRGPYRDAPCPDLILLDLNLPVIDGIEVLTCIKRDPDLTPIPVIVFTTPNSEEDVLNSYRLHANCFIPKPINLGQFVHVIQMIEAFWTRVVTLPRPRLRIA